MRGARPLPPRLQSLQDALNGGARGVQLKECWQLAEGMFCLEWVVKCHALATVRNVACAPGGEFGYMCALLCATSGVGCAGTAGDADSEGCCVKYLW
jgi:hypothetical protein